MKKLLLFIFLPLLLIGCQSKTTPEQRMLAGMALGTDYHIKFFTDKTFDVQKGIDSIFAAANKSMSNYQPDSDISRLNAGDTTIHVDQIFRDVFELSKKIYKSTHGYFDPTIGDIVNLYGFGAQKMTLEQDSATIDSMMQYVGFDKVKLSDANLLERTNPNIYIDFNAIGKGFTVDLVGLYLEAQGVTDYLVEIGGEIRTRGKNLESGRAWRLGIDDPRLKTHADNFSGIVKLYNQGMATSGNYRKHRLDSVTGQKYVHIVDPTSGYMHKTNILSASVIAKNCATADAYATAFMAMGVQKSIDLVNQLDSVEVFLIYDNQGELKTYVSKGFEKQLVAQN